MSVSLPTFGWVVAGLLLRRLGLLTEPLINRVSQLAFSFGLPLMLFASAVRVDYSTIGSALYLWAGVLATFLTVGLAWIYSHWRGHARALQGIFVQGAYRSNLAIIGIALAVAAYGEEGLVLAAMPVALLTVLYNVLAVWMLNATLGAGTSGTALLLGIARNPLIIGISAGILWALGGVPVPGFIAPMGAGISTFFLPLMLLCIGGAMQLSNLRKTGLIAWEATAWRLCVAPLLAVLLALALGVRDQPLGILFLLLSSPVAAASFVMVVAARGDGVLAANIVVLSTLLSIFTVTAGFFLLTLFSLAGQPG
ncbi:MAG: AEC family transporter [Halioglobus sp.]|nr:AEC family transporter [Halioglobus sp.]